MGSQTHGPTQEGERKNGLGLVK
jgi:hypothetical protein